MEIKKKNNKYIVLEEVNAGYLQRSSWLYLTIKTIWSKNLKLEYFEIAGKDVTYFFNIKGKLRKDIDKNEDHDFRFHGNRALRARNRHLKAVKIELGLIEKEAEQSDMFITTGRSYYQPFKLMEIVLTKEGKPNKKELPAQNCSCTIATPQKIKLMEEYNRRYNELFKFRKKVFEKLFEENKEKNND